MPLVTITAADHYPQEWYRQVADIVNEVVIETLDFPVDDRYQIIQALPAERIELQTRSGDALILQLTMRSGRSSTAKQHFYKKVAETLEQKVDVDPANLMIVITENKDADWSFGDGKAQFLV
ncbi:putative tautomerase YolI [Kushneria pakistanensis]|uniref:Tautomerase YolI n=1 Tax=Kushneria pakistanensis TaxID=1508770 RepID=A0ABQ3FBG9_9GAMM|nr:tautomerase family protein [Kushneria pakistanensis]GHC16802.1 putative tautomerase YolI [Kushneria pakistanensis]